ncbi:MAG: hypothetical protein K0Q72_631 [Armatimonadetes bacterium]|jgi:hypothetical protein|nr:hypothetical protein [Armatimonadota bacterium]
MRSWALFLLIVLPGLAAIFVSGYYLFSDWAALNAAFARFERLAAGGADLRALTIAQTNDQVYRINCFADGVGVMLGAILAAIGIHGLCVMPRNPGPAPGPPSPIARTGALLGVLASLAATLVLCGYLIERVGSTNALRQAIVRGDAREVKAQLDSGADVNDAFWWRSRPLRLARRASGGPGQPQIVRMLESAGARE